MYDFVYEKPKFFSPAAGRNKRCPHVSDVAQQLCAGCKKSPRNLFLSVTCNTIAWYTSRVIAIKSESHFKFTNCVKTGFSQRSLLGHTTRDPGCTPGSSPTFLFSANSIHCNQMTRRTPQTSCSYSRICVIVTHDSGVRPQDRVKAPSSSRPLAPIQRASGPATGLHHAPCPAGPRLQWRRCLRRCCPAAAPAGSAA